MRALLTITALLLSLGVDASEDHEEGGGARTGPNKAVLEASADRGMKLADKALRRLGVQTSPLAGVGPYKLTVKALVYSKEEVGIYRLRSGWYKHLDVEVATKERGFAVVRAKDLRAGDRVVVAGAALLRVAELDVLGAEVTDHGH